MPGHPAGHLCARRRPGQGAVLPEIQPLAKAMAELLRSSLLPQGTSVVLIKDWLGEATSGDSQLIMDSLDWRFRARKPNLLWTMYA